VARGSADGGSAAALPPQASTTDLFLQDKSQQLIDRFSKVAAARTAWSTPRHHQAGSFLAGADGAWVNGQVLRAQRRARLSSDPAHRKGAWLRTCSNLTWSIAG
jgi:hypothetical protein